MESTSISSPSIKKNIINLESCYIAKTLRKIKVWLQTVRNIQ